MAMVSGIYWPLRLAMQVGRNKYVKTVEWCGVPQKTYDFILLLECKSKYPILETQSKVLK